MGKKKISGSSHISLCRLGQPARIARLFVIEKEE